jgi:hypothetical protein
VFQEGHGMLWLVRYMLSAAWISNECYGPISYLEADKVQRKLFFLVSRAVESSVAIMHISICDNYSPHICAHQYYDEASIIVQMGQIRRV